MSVRLLNGDCLAILPTLPADSVDCVVTSPPYWGLRDYGLSKWEGGDQACDHFLPVEGGKSGNKGQVQTHAGRFSECRCGARRVSAGIGLEPTLQEHLDSLVAVFREVRRVLKPTGTCWVNYGDAYATGTTAPRGPTTTEGDHVPASWSNRCQKERIGTPSGFKTKDRMMLPARLAIALQEDGWWLRDEIVWHKPNPMPSSVRDRTTPAHEMIYLLTKRPKYFFDQEAIKTPVSPKTLTVKTTPRKGDGTASQGEKLNAWMEANGGRKHPESANKRSVWTVAPKPFKEAHFATFPPALIEPCILAGCPSEVCSACGAPWVRVVEKVDTGRVQKMADGWDTESGGHGTVHRGGRESGARGVPVLANKTVGFKPTCKCAAPTVPGVVLDPFGGAGTTALVAEQHSRDSILIELSPEYSAIAARRIEAVAPLFVTAVQSQMSHAAVTTADGKSSLSTQAPSQPNVTCHTELSRELEG